MLSGGEHQPHFPAGAFGDIFFYFCQSLTSHLPFSFPSPFDLSLIKGSSDLNIFPVNVVIFFLLTSSLIFIKC